MIGPAHSTDEPLRCFQNRYELLSFAAEQIPAYGLILEFGVATGSTINWLAEVLFMRRIYGFDSFAGLPEVWGNYPAGHFACEPPKVEANVELVIGSFAATLPNFLATHDGDIALLHLDADLYSSTRTVLELLTSRIVPGTVIVMDEFYIEVHQEQRAFLDWLMAYGRRYRKLARTNEGLAVQMD